MKKLINASIFYTVLGLVAGVFFREFTKMMNFDGITALSTLHTHLFALGTIMSLIFVILEKQFKLSEHKLFNKFFIVYNLGLISVALTMLWRGIDQVLAMNTGAMLSGIAGVSHIILTIGLVLFFIVFKQTAENKA